MEVTARFDFDKVCFDQDNCVHLLLSLRAPKINWIEQRPKLAIMPAIDISSSMGFASKLNYAKDSLLKMIDHLGSEDYCGLVTFGSEANLLSPPVLMNAENKDKLKSLVKKLQAYGNTAFASGMVMALKELRQLDKDIISRVIMFTDGEANVGASKIADILALLPENLGRATVSAFGYGKDAKQDILDALAIEAKGNYAFIETPDNAPAAFAKELGGLLSVFATDLKITLRTREGLVLEQVVTDVSSSMKDGNCEIKLPELLSEEVRNLVVKCKLPAGTEPKVLDVLDLEINSTTLHPVQELTRTMTVQIETVVRGEHQDKATKEVDDLVTLAQMVRAQVDAAKLAERGLFVDAEACMTKFAAAAQTKGQVGFSSAAGRMKSLYGDRVTYDSRSGYLRSFQKLGTRAVGASSVASDALEEVKTLGVFDSSEVFLNNSAQDELLKSFKEEDKK